MTPGQRLHGRRERSGREDRGRHLTWVIGGLTQLALPFDGHDAGAGPQGWIGIADGRPALPANIAPGQPHGVGCGESQVGA